MINQPDANKKANRLIHEKSPYLLQHAYNPVDWYPWGEEAFNRAIKENKPVFLSVGYSSCHWCHVMAEESFEDPEVAALLNYYFVAVKVDREERPDIDAIYLKAATIISGSGGWPISLFLTPEQQPFAGGTYFPPESRWGKPGFKDVLRSVHNSWVKEQDQIGQVSETVNEYLQSRQNLSTPAAKEFDQAVWDHAYQEYVRHFDWRFGGLKDAPKFPSAHVLSFLLRSWHRRQDPQALSMVEKTLTAVAEGGIHDHLAGGFHRYSTDERWHLPHFEKMLYDQALLAKMYLETYQATGKDFYKRIACQTLDYVFAELSAPEGGFYSAVDADSLEREGAFQPSGKKEGAYYLWAFKEVQEVLDKTEAAVFCEYYGVVPSGNVRLDPAGEFDGKNVLAVARSLEAVAKGFDISVGEAGQLIKSGQSKLLARRKSRPRPQLDDKLLVDWNGLMISALASAAMVTGDERYRIAAERAARFIINNLVTKDGQLLHTATDSPQVQAYLDDYAFFVQGLIELYEATYRVEYLRWARDLAHKMIELFGDEDAAGFYLTANNSDEMIVRPREVTDGALPSGNAVAALDLVRLAHLLRDSRLEKRAQDLILHILPQMRDIPTGYPQMLVAADAAFYPNRDIVISASATDNEAPRLIQRLRQRYLPNMTVILRPGTINEARPILDLIPSLAKRSLVDGRTTVYICEDYQCRLPINNIAEFYQYLDTLDRNVN